MSKHMDRIVREAVATGLLDPATISTPAEERHWAVLVLTAFGAWLSALPFVVLFFVLDLNRHGYVGMTIAALILIASVFVLRAREIALFAEQLGVPGLLVGAGLLASQVASNTHSDRDAINILLLVACAVVVPVRQAWIRTLLGAAIGVLAATRLSVRLGYESPLMPAQLACSAVACGWLLLHIVQRVLVLDDRSAPIISGLEALSGGLGAAALANMIWFSGRTFLLGAVFSPSGDDIANVGSTGTICTLSVTLTLVGGSWLALRWPVVRTGWYAVLVAVGMTLAWFAPFLGATLLILSVCLESRRHVLATFAGFAAVWMIGGFYYVSAWPLATKALLLAGVGLALMLLGRYVIEAPLAPAEPEPLAQPVPWLPNKRARAGILLSGLLVLGVANSAIWQKEYVIRTGTAVYVELAPADPRSLMQGDYMRLSFRLPTPSTSEVAPWSVPKAVASLDERGVAQLLRFHDGGRLAKGEFLIDLVRRHDAWTLVTDAWYFKEGESERWSKARYGEFRVAPDGKALLVGLRGPNLEKF